MAENASSTRRTGRIRRHARLRKKIEGSPQRPRLVVTRSSRHMVAQVIDDVAGRTVAAASTLTARDASGANVDAASAVGKRVAEAALAAGVTKVVFDRGGFLFHGRVKALAEAAREAGLEF